MESYKIKNLSFTYPGKTEKVLDSINLTIEQGEFITLCGKSGCGKTTFLRLLKSSLAPYGELAGDIYFDGKLIKETDALEQTSKIGFVMQNPDNQVVTDKVWHELAFGLESMGLPTPEIRTKVAEMASFFGINEWFYKNVSELSGGQKQLLNLASVMVMQPTVLILDEPTSQLDPIASQEFLKTLEKINKELGTTVILSEHRLEDAFTMSDRVLVMDEGRVIADDVPQKIGDILKKLNHSMYKSLPVPVRVYGAVDNGDEYPVTVRDGRCWLEDFSKKHKLKEDLIPNKKENADDAEPAVEIKDVWFKYDKDLPDIIKGINVKIRKGEIFAIVGGNGSGKTTLLSLVKGVNVPYRGKIFINGMKLSECKALYGGTLGVLPQNPQTLFVKNTVCLDLMEVLSDKSVSEEEKEATVRRISRLCRISDLLNNHPYDLSGGEQQRAALAKVLLMSPQILLLDEPTKGMDASFKEIFADIVLNLKNNGVTVVLVSHDIEFCAEYADRCAMIFDGDIVSEGLPREFFAGKSFYTTSANRMARTKLKTAVLAEDIILACGGEKVKKEKSDTDFKDFYIEKKENINVKEKKQSRKKIFSVMLLAILFIVTMFFEKRIKDGVADIIFQTLTIIEIAVALIYLIPQKEIGTIESKRAKLTKRTLVAVVSSLILIPATLYFGTTFLHNRKYYIISLLIIAETIIPFIMVFEKRKPQARELVIISVLCAITVAGRMAFATFPQFKPTVALVIISGVCFGGETGFLVGAVSGFVSNFFFGQGPWTPWQMFTLGIIGCLSGIVFNSRILKKTQLTLAVYGGLVTLIIYGGIMNPASILMYQEKITLPMIITAYANGLRVDLVHAVSTVFFLWFIAEPFIEKLERVKIKYGLIKI